MPNLLLIDDDKEVLKINAKYFIQDGYTVKAATNARTAYKLLKDYTPDCIVLDVMMPGIDGFKACTELKKLCQAPVIFLTGRDSEDDKVQGLLLGADDYMIKPYSLRELSARIQVLIRRYQKTSVVSAAVLEYPPLRLELNVRKHSMKMRKFLSPTRNMTCFTFWLLLRTLSSPSKISDRLSGDST